MTNWSGEDKVVERETCRNCGAPMDDVLDLGSHYISDFPKPGEAPAHPRIPLVLAQCDLCTLVQLRHTAPRDWLYREYWYRSGVNESMRRALADVISVVLRYVDLYPDDWVVDIGANDGTLLSLYRDYSLVPYTTQRVGFDPALNLSEDLRKSCEIIVPDFFPTPGFSLPGGARAKVVTAIAMFYDLEDPNAFLRGVKEILHPEGVFVLQLGDLTGMLTSCGFDTICHEHLEYYSLRVLDAMLANAGLVIAGVGRNQVNGGSVRVCALPAGRVRAGTIQQVEDYIDADERIIQEHPMEIFRTQVELRKEGLLAMFDALYHTGAIVDVYGASTKGNTLLQYYGLRAGPVEAVEVRWAIERSPAKVGRVTVGTDIPIVTEEQAREFRAEFWLVLPWHFRDAIINRERTLLRGPDRPALIFPLPKLEVVTAW